MVPTRNAVRNDRRDQAHETHHAGVGHYWFRNSVTGYWISDIGYRI